jgi:hypothetical protein
LGHARRGRYPYNLTDPMKTIDEMLNLDLLTREQHGEISAWIARSASPEEILQMRWSVRAR